MRAPSAATVVHAGSTRYHRQLRAAQQGQRPVVLLAMPGLSRAAATAQARSVAASLGRRLQRIALDRVKGRYVGETEKNLARLLEGAEAAGAILWFDEADALFGKRTGVRDAHDRYANQEVGRVLGRLARHSTLITLAPPGRTESNCDRLACVRIVVRPPIRKV